MRRRASSMVKSGPNGMLVAAFSVALLALTFLLTVPAKAQDTVAGSQYTSSEEMAQADAAGEGDSRAATDPGGETARITESTTDTDEIVDRLVVPVADCEVGTDAFVVVEDNDGTQVRLTNGENVTITADANAVTIEGTAAGGNLRGINASGGDDPQFGTEGETVEGEIVNSTGITCGRDATTGTGTTDTGTTDTGTTGTTDTDTTDDTARTADDLQDLSCEQLLAQFRAGSGSAAQYGDAVALANADVQSRIEVCLEQEVVQGTAAGEDLPDTGGVSLLGLAVLGVVSAAAGLSMIRGGRREG